MTVGVLLYCFDTPDTAYHKLATKCIELVKKNLRVPITVVTDNTTHKKLNTLDVSFKIVEQSKNNFRFYRGKNVPWYNMERAKAFDHSDYDTTLLMDCDYFCFTDNLLEICKCEHDFLLHNKVHDVTGKDRIQGRLESILPIVWATVVMFKKTDRVQRIFDMIKHVQQNYEHFRNLYRIKFKNYRNDYAFAIALHQLNGQIPHNEFIPVPMNMLPHEYDVLAIDNQSVIFKYNNKVNVLSDMDVHILDKEFANAG